MSQAFAFLLGIKTRKTNIRDQKINNITLETNKIVVSTFFIFNKDDKERFFEKSFLLANVKLDIVLGCIF